MVVAGKLSTAGASKSVMKRLPEPVIKYEILAEQVTGPYAAEGFYDGSEVRIKMKYA